MANDCICEEVEKFCFCFANRWSSLLKKLAVLKLFLKTKQILLPLQLWRSTSDWTQSCGMPVPARFVSLPAVGAVYFPQGHSEQVCTQAHHALESYVLFQFGCQAQTPHYPLPVFPKLEKFSLFYTSLFLVNFCCRWQHQQTRKWSLRSPIILICRHSLYANCIMWRCM